MGSLIISSSESQRDLCLFLNNEFLMFYRKKIFFSQFLIGIEFIQQIVFFQFFSIQHNNIHTCMYIIWWCRYFNKHTSYCTCIVKSVYSHCTKSVCSCLEICDWEWGGGGINRGIYSKYLILLSIPPVKTPPPTYWHIKVAYHMRAILWPWPKFIWPRWRSHHHQKQNGILKVFFEQLLVLFSFVYGEVKLLFLRKVLLGALLNIFSLCLI